MLHPGICQPIRKAEGTSKALQLLEGVGGPRVQKEKGVKEKGPQGNWSQGLASSWLYAPRTRHLPFLSHSFPILLKAELA